MLERRQGGDVVSYVLRVEQVYKGDISGRLDVVTPVGGAACGLEARVGDRLGLLLELSEDGETWGASLCSKVEPAAFLELADVEDNALPPLNWGGIVVGVLILLAAGWFLARRARRYRTLR